LFASGSIQLTGVLSGALIAHLLGPSQRGLLAAIILWPSMVAYVGDLGGPLAYTFLSSRRGSEPDQLSELVGSTLAIAVVQSLVLTAIGIPLAVLAMRSYSPVVPVAASFAAAYIPLNVLTRYANALNQGTSRFRRFNAVRMTVQFVYVAGVVILFVFHTASINLILVITIGSNVAAMIVAIWPWWRGMSTRTHLNLDVAKRTFAFGLRAQLGNVSPMEMMQLDLAFVFLALGPRDAGFYAVALSMSAALRSTGVSIGIVTLPSVAQARDESFRNFVIGRSVRLTALFAVPAAIILAAAAGILVPLLFGSQFAASVPVVQILSVGAAFSSLKRVLGDSLRGSGNPLAASMSELIGLCTGLVALTALTGPLGILGAAAAATLSYATMLLAAILIASRRWAIPPLELLIPRWEDVRLAFSVAQEVVKPARLGQA
jgi:antigen flippase